MTKKLTLKEYQSLNGKSPPKERTPKAEKPQYKPQFDQAIVKAAIDKIGIKVRSENVQIEVIFFDKKVLKIKQSNMKTKKKNQSIQLLAICV